MKKWSTAPGAIELGIATILVWHPAIATAAATVDTGAESLILCTILIATGVLAVDGWRRIMDHLSGRRN